MQCFWGGDSDVLIDLIENTEHNCTVNYVFFDTGLEYAATKEHLSYLESRYGITITRFPAKLPIPAAIHKYGVPFLSKRVSRNVQGLQHCNFDWSADTASHSDEKYAHSQTYIKWWNSEYCHGNHGISNINANRGLREFMSAFPPDYKISDKCCTAVKKKTAKEAYKHFKPDLEIIGVRKLEGGNRSVAYDTCFSLQNSKGCAEYRPLFFWTDNDKEVYCRAMDVVHSKCYTLYGMKRTGCAGCPFNSAAQADLERVKDYEPKLYKAAWNLFGKSYDYTQRYRAFRADLNNKEKKNTK